MSYSLGGLEVDNYFESKKYEERLDNKLKKSNGIYYTPKFVVDYILDKTLKHHNILENPYPKVIDISCGCGNFLLEAYDVLYCLLEENIDNLKEKYKSEYWCIENIHSHILKNCIYGIDIDKNAIEILKKSLIQKGNYIEEISTIKEKLNIYCEDGLKKEFDFKFDYILGNPPYVGHKALDKEYKKYLLKEYNGVYKDKSDLYFCFYKRGIDLMKDNGVLAMITPRYFMESQSGYYLRKYIKENTKINEIVDFLSLDIFKNVGISSCIITLSKIKDDDNIKVYKQKENYNDKINNLMELLESEFFENFDFSSENLDENWMIVKNEDLNFYKKINSYSNYKLGDIVTSFQGIITGCDKAFIIDDNDKRINYIPKELIKSWIKNKDIKSYVVNNTNLKLIYSNDIKDENLYEEVIENCIKPYKEKLENRRECKNNIRKWYELQWGREKKLFERKKIMYPYKSKTNRFAIDFDNLYSSADVYSFYIKEEYLDIFSYEYLVGILNSEVYNKYYKLTAKQMGKDVYDYYPNKVMEIRIFKDKNYNEIEKLSKEVINILKKEKVENNKRYIKILENKINDLILNSFNI